MFLGLCASIGCAGLLQAQVTNVTWRGTVGLVTTNNVTYAEFMWPLYGFLCENVVGTGPLVGNGSNFWYNFELTEPVTPMICHSVYRKHNHHRPFRRARSGHLHLDDNLRGACQL